MHISTVEVAGLTTAMIAMRLPHNSEENSDSTIPWYEYETGGLQYHVISPTPNKSKEGYFYRQYFSSGCFIGKNDLALLSKLVASGDEHGKAARGIIVWADITAPRYWWQEMDTYRIGTDCLSSESTMHDKKFKGLSGEKLQKAKAEVKEGLMQRRVRTFSYQCLRRIYKQRRKHRLPEWGEFCSWIETLPFSKELITVDKIS